MMIESEKANNFSLTGDFSVYYLSIVADGVVVADRVPRSEAAININARGYVDDSPSEPIGAIPVGTNVYLRKPGTGSFLGQPERGMGSQWDAGTFRMEGDPHRLYPATGSDNLTGGVLIVSASTTLTDASYKYLYCSTDGFTYYDKSRSPGPDRDKQTWVIKKTSDPSNSGGEVLHYGDKVTIRNENWSDTFLGGSSGWATCKRGDSAVWVLQADGRAS